MSLGLIYEIKFVEKDDWKVESVVIKDDCPCASPLFNFWLILSFKCNVEESNCGTDALSFVINFIILRKSIKQ